MKRTTGHGSVWVTLKHSSDKSKAQRNKMKTAGKNIEFKCLIRATGGKKNISIMVVVEIHGRLHMGFELVALQHIIGYICGAQSICQLEPFSHFCSEFCSPVHAILFDLLLLEIDKLIGFSTCMT
ncbi:signal recognition particle 14 kDa protein-like isoform X2 [Capsicum annuum]|uniref:signal recognition particle 14 kDa protein-like isoform X2 n=1 Tax=Capsicum annuum TaxID=4072 RepID=UPI001FB06F4A|nr:signal recognition particle 14 kDa protein-like isoform X2 [Capsicum annuum]